METQNLGPLTALLNDNTIFDIMVNDYQHIYVSRQAFRIDDVAETFESEAQLWQVIEQLTVPYGVTVNAANPIVDVLLPDETRVHIVVPPVSGASPVLAMRKSARTIQMPTWETLIKYGSLTQPMLDFLRWAVKAHLNLCVSGGTGSGKTTILNLIAMQAHEKSRLITVERQPDLNINHPNLVRLFGRPADLAGNGEITPHHLMQSALKMRPDRIISSEIEGDEIVDILTAMSNGIDGSMFSLHATTPRDALLRLEILLTNAQPNVPLLMLRQELARTLHLIVQINILQDGWRKIQRISEVRGIINGEIELVDIFEWVQTGIQEDGKLLGYHTATGYVPTFASQTLKVTGLDPLPDSFFTPTQPN